MPTILLQNNYSFSAPSPQTDRRKRKWNARSVPIEEVRFGRNYGVENHFSPKESFDQSWWARFSVEIFMDRIGTT